ncbi:MAG: hypothetical protein J6J61_04625 [Muribaculaceae bacterium]|nr:hypothetical protein [Muribaculaceae bacterium]
MFESAVEWSVNQINENFQLSADLDKYTFDLGGDALAFAKSVWDVSMVLAAVVFAIVACFELYSLSVRNEARGGPMGSAEIVFKVMFKVAVCYVMLQVSFEILQNLYLTSNSLTEAIGGIAYGSSMDREIINWDEVKDDVPSKFGGLGVFAMSLVVVFVSWAAKYVALVLILCRLVQIYVYLAIAPIPLATFPSQEYSQIGKSFLKSFVAVALQGSLIYLVVRFLPPLVASALDSNVFLQGGSLMADMTIAALFSVAILITIVGTQQLSRRICNAM